jgi:hypothetical protein
VRPVWPDSPFLNPPPHTYRSWRFDVWLTGSTLTNPNTSDEAKAHARAKLAELGIKEEVHEGNHEPHQHQGHSHEHHPRPHVHTPGHHVPEAQHEHHVLGGYKA